MSGAPMSQPRGTARRRWLIGLPFALVVVLAAVWSIAWYLAAQRADATITAWIEQEARAGRLYRCGTRTTGGYPFRIEVRCAEPSVELAGAEPPRALRAKSLLGVAQVYQPDLIIAEIAGPLEITQAGEPVLWRADWGLAQASLRGIAGTPERLSIVLDAVRLDAAGESGAPFAAANHVELHVRRDPASAPDQPVLDLAAQGAGMTMPSATLLGGKPIDGDMTALVRGISDLRPKPLPDRLRQWQAAGGRLQVTKLRLQQGDATAIASGEVGLAASGRPDGAFNVSMVGFEQVMQQLVGPGRGANLQLGLVAGLSLLGRPAEIDGKRALALSLRVKDGAVFLGPIPLGKIDPLF